MSEQENTVNAPMIDAAPDTAILNITTQELTRFPLVVADGDVDLCTAPLLRSALVAACEDRNEAGGVVLDLRLVPFIDSAGLALLVEIRKRFLAQCQLALIIEKGSQPERVLRLGRFDTFLKVGYSLEDLNQGVFANS